MVVDIVLDDDPHAGVHVPKASEDQQRQQHRVEWVGDEIDRRTVVAPRQSDGGEHDPDAKRDQGDGADPLGKFVLFGMTLSMFYHLGQGIKHLFWDMGEGFQLKTAEFTSWLVIGFTVVASVLTWALAYMTGAL